MSDLYRFIIIGDFNLTSIAWLGLPDTEEFTPLSSSSTVLEWTSDFKFRFRAKVILLKKVEMVFHKDKTRLSF